ncbi:MAG: 23S rRNA (guanosine(2251)-2'-O)-methyltransferase RlmB [Chloroflexota bacterium]|nr:23S rRNA (guanosine(2251)-2'-O)-methyltransferase RlmB [Dehalococcoidia bacterium]MDW8253094.1 23S rRNA (guanosine(2251)-2'-O)-methyltransferase RlmB [Chloroflexota bacterium]
MPTETILGRHAVSEALRAGRPIRRLLVVGARGLVPPSYHDLAALARQHDIPVHIVNRQTLDRLGAQHQGIAAEVEPFAYVELDALFEAAAASGRPFLAVVLDSVQDPQNFGTLLRTAAALGAHGILLPKHRSVAVTPAVERASAGAVSRLRIHRATNLPRALDQLRERGVWVYGIDARAPLRYDQVDLTGPIALVVGSEGAGISRLVGEHCDRMLRVPMAGEFDSLNVAVAGSIVLAEVFRQRERVGEAAEGPLPPKQAKASSAAGARETAPVSAPPTPGLPRPTPDRQPTRAQGGKRRSGRPPGMGGRGRPGRRK